jgi:hypothetical protein
MRRVAVRPSLPPRRRRLAAPTRLLATALVLAVAGVASPAAAQGPGAPIDRTVVAIPPVYPASAPGLLRLPETRSAPIAPARRLPEAVPGAPTSVVPTAPTERPVWHPARLEAVPAIDARGRVTTILEYTPGRFDR